MARLVTDVDVRLTDLVKDLSARGVLSPEWRAAFASVRRDVFLPDTVWQVDGDGLVPLRRADDPAGWLDAAYADAAVITQVDDGRPVGPAGRGREMTSSASEPGVVALMLDELNIEPGQRVCEIGTGTGYNAALLCARLGAENVTSIEIDPEVAEAARKALDGAGFRPCLVVGDGAEGYRPNAPYDRVIATAAAGRVPYAWVAQTRPGGRVLVPWASAYHNGALLALTVGADGTASGGFVGNVAFMWLRQQRTPIASVEDDVHDLDRAETSVTDLHPYDVVGEYDASLAIGLRVPSCKNIVVLDEDGSGAYTVWFIDQKSGSWASIGYERDAADCPVRQFGPRRLWDEIAAAYRWWDDHGRPGRERYGVTVTPETQSVWLDEPTNVVTDA